MSRKIKIEMIFNASEEYIKSDVFKKAVEDIKNGDVKKEMSMNGFECESVKLQFLDDEKQQ